VARGGHAPLLWVGGDGKIAISRVAHWPPPLPKGLATNWRERSQSCREPQQEVEAPKIHTIVGRFAGGGESKSGRKAYARRVFHHEVYVVEMSMK
jgi:hypothetical protein